ncbi:MAG TPA: hypothetical protein VK447_01115 [Myxococcaceae bacterium]|nr:hypothetical protein [Myxococcaceae bacterium]
MEGPSQKACATCGRRIAPRELYYSFTLVVRGEQDLIDPSSAGGPSEDELEALIERLKQGPEDVREMEEQVNWERTGVICTWCRSLMMRVLAHPPEEVEPH